MDELFQDEIVDDRDWPTETQQKYVRWEILGKGSFGKVWLCRRTGPAEDYDDEEFVAIKNIAIKNDKSQVYAEREIAILKELRHPNVIRLVRAYPVHEGVRVVVMQLARGPNLHQLVTRRGCLGLPLSRLVSRQLISAVSYLHGRAVIHRDIKPSNCILACNTIPATRDYDWFMDDAIWSSKQDGIDAVKQNKWKLMLVDFGFARALETSEIEAQSRHLRNSIVFEKTSGPKPAAARVHSIKVVSTPIEKLAEVEGEDDTERGEDDDVKQTSKQDDAENKNKNGERNQNDPNSNQPTPAAQLHNGDTGSKDDGGDSLASDEMDLEELGKLAEQAAMNMRHTTFEPTNDEEAAIMGEGRARPRLSGISLMPDQEPTGAGTKKRFSTARHHVRSMSALGTKAYAAPEIRKKLRHKTEEDFEKENAAMTECVADYGMIVDAYSVGWTIRVAMTGVPPNFTISEYMRQRTSVIMEDEEIEEEVVCCCFRQSSMPRVQIRDPRKIPSEATILISCMTEKNPENRMTVREAQNHPWIAGGDGEEPYTPPQGDVPSLHGDPVVPLTCAPQLSRLTIQYHMQ